MALTQWVPTTNRSGTATSPALEVPPVGQPREVVYAELTGTHSDPLEWIDYATEWTDAAAASDPQAEWHHLVGGRFVGGDPVPKLGVFAAWAPVPPQATFIRARYDVQGTVRFGVRGEFRSQ